MLKIKLLLKSFFPLIIIGIIIGCQTQAQESEVSEIIKIRTAPVIQKEISIPVITGGKLASKKEMKLSFKTGGIVDKILVDEGSIVKEGQLLAKLNLSEIEAQVAQARSGFEKAKRDLDRIEKLYKEDFATLEQFQNATTSFEVARSNLQIAEFNLQHSSIFAPLDGKILKRFAEVNELTSPGLPIFILAASTEDWIFRVGVTDRDIVKLQIGDSAVITFDAFKGERFPALVSEIASISDPRSGTYEVELSVLPKGYKFISGFVGKAKISPSIKCSFFTVPIESLIEGNGDDGFVFSYEASALKVRKIPVKIGHIFEKEIGIISGLEGVKEVVTDGASYVEDGSSVLECNNRVIAK
ncbi:MAG: efflux RND transporter periplasmic adaptor subunit [Candidatus Cloacimonetes bacterium]|nr:efflux RND transporter periplasmic adaptor subunit [Candidatus Cloacimonadota bacterium]